VIQYTCTKSGVNNSSGFPVRTNRQTDATERPTHVGSCAGLGNYKLTINIPAGDIFGTLTRSLIVCWCRSSNR